MGIRNFVRDLVAEMRRNATIAELDALRDEKEMIRDRRANMLVDERNVDRKIAVIERQLMTGGA